MLVTTVTLVLGRGHDAYRAHFRLAPVTRARHPHRTVAAVHTHIIVLHMLRQSSHYLLIGAYFKFITRVSTVIVLFSLYIGQQLVLHLALLSCSLCSVKLHAVLLFVEQIKKERKEGRKQNVESKRRGECCGVHRNP